MKKVAIVKNQNNLANENARIFQYGEKYGYIKKNRIRAYASRENSIELAAQCIMKFGSPNRVGHINQRKPYMI